MPGMKPVGTGGPEQLEEPAGTWAAEQDKADIYSQYLKDIGASLAVDTWAPGAEVGEPWTRSIHPPCSPRGGISRDTETQNTASRVESRAGFYPNHKPTVKLIGNNSRKKKKQTPKHQTQCVGNGPGVSVLKALSGDTRTSKVQENLRVSVFPSRDVLMQCCKRRLGFSLCSLISS